MMAKRRHIVCLFCAWSIFVRCFSNFFCRFSLLLCFHLCWGFLLSFSVCTNQTRSGFSKKKTIKYSKNKYVFMNSIERVKILSASLYLFYFIQFICFFSCFIQTKYAECVKTCDSKRFFFISFEYFWFRSFSALKIWNFKIESNFDVKTNESLQAWSSAPDFFCAAFFSLV